MDSQPLCWHLFLANTTQFWTHFHRISSLQGFIIGFMDLSWQQAIYLEILTNNDSGQKKKSIKESTVISGSLPQHSFYNTYKPLKSYFWGDIKSKGPYSLCSPQRGKSFVLVTVSGSQVLLSQTLLTRACVDTLVSLYQEFHKLKRTLPKGWARFTMFSGWCCDIVRLGVGHLSKREWSPNPTPMILMDVTKPKHHTNE